MILCEELEAITQSIQMYVGIGSIALHRDNFQVATKVPCILQKFSHQQGGKNFYFIFFFLNIQGGSWEARNHSRQEVP